jgi:DNA polymerase/3'-5' exonuclease PolX
MTVAEGILKWLRPACVRIEIAGSVRRQKPAVGDIEIVAIPRYDEERDLLGEVFARRSQLDDALGQMMAAGIIRPGERNGERFKQFWVLENNLPLDLFVTDPDRWGLIYIIRTGSADFSHWLVTGQQWGGALPENHQVRDGRLWRVGQDEPLDTPEERDVFVALGLEWVEPWEREKGRWETLTMQGID